MNEFEHGISDVNNEQTSDACVDEKKPLRDKYLSRVFFAMFWSWICGYVGMGVIYAVLLMVIPESVDSSWGTIGTSAFSTVFTMLLFAIFLPRSDHARHPVTAKLNRKAAVRFGVIACGIMFVGTFLGTGLSMVFGSLMGIEIENVVDEMVNNTDFLPMMIGVAVFAPIFEELIFRKFLIDSLSRYGTVFCCVISGLLFGVFHGNFYQFFYAFGLGVLLAFIYCIYGKISYTIIMHSIINIFGSAVPLAVGMISEKYIWVSAIYVMIYFAVAVTGVCFLIKDIKWFKCYTVEGSVENPFGKLVNAGFIALMILGVLIFALCIF